jgi:hypothetical protein
MKMNKYCVEIRRECEEMMVHHFEFEGIPTREDVLKEVESLDCNYDDKYGKITFYKVFD